MRIVEIVKQVAQEAKATLSQIALAWLLVQGNEVVPIPGTKRKQYLKERVDAVGVKLTAPQMNRLGELAQMTAGPRYGEAMMARVER